MLDIIILLVLGLIILVLILGIILIISFGPHNFNLGKILNLGFYEFLVLPEPKG